MKGILYIVSAMLIIACNNASAPLHIKQTTTQTDNLDALHETDSFYVATEANYQVGLWTDKQGDLVASKYIVEPKVSKNSFFMVAETIVDENKEKVVFRDGAHLLEFMKEHGYKLQSQTEEVDHTSFLFEKTN